MLFEFGNKEFEKYKKKEGIRPYRPVFVFEPNTLLSSYEIFFAARLS